MTVRPDLRLEATEARLAAMALPEGGAWVRAAREGAVARVRSLGLPRRRDEYWRFTDPATLVEPTPPAAEAAPADDPAFESIDAARLVFADGRFDPAASDAMPGGALEIETLATAASRDDHWAAGVYGVLEADAHVPVPRSLAALNSAMATDGVVIRATGTNERPIHVAYRRDAADADPALHHVVRVEAGASLTLLESGGAARLSSVLEVEMGEGATFRHVRVQSQGTEGRAVTHVVARLAARADFRSFTLTFDGALTRNEAVVRLEGDDGVAHVAGAVLGQGVAVQHDDTVFITHEGQRCESRQVFKKVLRAGAVGVFQGKILVRPGAQKTDGYQLAQALLLHESSQFLAKPELEIYADDVVCSHGATVGAIDEGALFYLRSRGIHEAEARDLLTLSFLRQALDEVTDEALVDDLQASLEGWLARHR